MRISDWSSDVCSSDLEGRSVLVDRDALGGTQHLQRDVLQLNAQFLGDHFALRQDSDVFDHRLASIAKARRLDRRNLQPPAQLVYDQGGEGLAFDILGDDEERTAGLNDGRSEEHTSELQSLLRISYAGFCLQKQTRSSSDH